MEAEQLQEHEAQQLREHLALVLSSLLEAQTLPGGQNQVGPELLQRCQTLEQKTATFENIVCVLNREVERVAVTAEACSRQHRLDQDKIEALSNKVCAWWGLVAHQLCSLGSTEPLLHPQPSTVPALGCGLLHF